MMTTADFFSLAEHPGCPLDQVANFLHARVPLTTDQAVASAAARSCDRPDGPTTIIYDGSGEPGRPVWGFAQAVVDDCVRVAGLRFLYLVHVEDGRSVRQAAAELRQRLLRKTTHQYDEVGERLALPNGSRLTIGGYRTGADVERYLGIEWDGVVVEDADTVDVEPLRALAVCVRSSRRDWRARSYLMVRATEAEPGDQADPTAPLRLLRAAGELVTTCLAQGWSVEATRALVRERAGQGIPAGDHPALQFLRTALATAIDEAIVRNLPLLDPET